jgi:hypothetical protein
MLPLPAAQDGQLEKLGRIDAKNHPADGELIHTPVSAIDSNYLQTYTCQNFLTLFHRTVLMMFHAWVGGTRTPEIA